MDFKFDDIPAQPPIEWSTGFWNGPSITLSPEDPFGDLERLANPGIHVTKIVTPAEGWPIAMYCPLCKETTFLLSPWAIKPKDGDYWRMNEMYANEEFHVKHNLTFAMKPIEAAMRKRIESFGDR